MIHHSKGIYLYGVRPVPISSGNNPGGSGEVIKKGRSSIAKATDDKL